MPRNGFIDSHETKDGVVVWERDHAGNLIREVFPVKDFCYCFVPSNKPQDNPVRDIYGTPLRKIEFESKFDLNQYAKRHSGSTSESDVPIKYRVLQDEYHDCHQDTPMNVEYYDIEVEFDLKDGRGYPTPSNPYGRINMFQFYSGQHKNYVIFSLADADVSVKDDNENIDVIVIDCETESELLRMVAEYLDDTDILLGWNTEGFDIPYIMARSEILFGTDMALRMYCRDNYRASKREFIDAYGNEAVEYKLVGRQNIDMMECYKKFIPSEKKSFALGAVSEEDLGITKEEYDGDLGELFRKDPELFMKYALRDVQLLKWLDEMHKIVDLVINMTRSSCVPCRDSTGSVKLIEYDLMKFAHARGIILPDRKANEKESYDGAVVYDTVNGRHGYAGSVDLRSLYPFCMILLGLSTETMVYQLLGEYEDYIHVMTQDDSHGEVTFYDVASGEEYVALPSELYAIIKSEGWTISGAGTIFDGSLGLLAEYVQEGFALRSHYKDEMNKAFKAGDKVKGEMYNLYQKVVKVARLNAVYGASGNENFRLFDIRLAKSITLTAQVISKQQAFAAHDYIEKYLEGLNG